MQTKLTKLIGIEHPIVQAGMSWASSSAALPAAVSNAGGLGVLAAGPLYLDDLERELLLLKQATARPFGLNIPLYSPKSKDFLSLALKHQVPVVFASQGGPKPHLQAFKDQGILWFHVVASLEHALKAQDAGVDAVVVVGTEAGGHPPASDVSTLINVRHVLKNLSIPVIAGGGVADGWGIASLLALGAEAVQLGTRFLMTQEAWVHENYKQQVLKTQVHETLLVGRSLQPVRMINNDFAQTVIQAEKDGSDPVRIAELFQSGTLKKAALEGDMQWGKVELGQSAGLIEDVLSVKMLMAQLVQELNTAMQRMLNMGHQD
ncbi:MAG: nitronate monooxygenase [Betaproteobacteria bacterium]|jgi:enoyl-[acyl-carrier protein] reductase II